jgi:hypothetical protein
MLPVTRGPPRRLRLPAGIVRVGQERIRAGVVADVGLVRDQARVWDPVVQVKGRRLHREACRRAGAQVEAHLMHDAKRHADQGAVPASLDRPVMVAADDPLDATSTACASSA